MVSKTFVVNGGGERRDPVSVAGGQRKPADSLTADGRRSAEGGSPAAAAAAAAHQQADMRSTWANKLEFVLACLGYAVGLGNLWRFPYLCYKSGGGAFLIPYFIMMMVCSIPLLLMELTMGQYTRQGPVGALGRLCPLFKGAGVAMVVISYLFCSYYNVVIGWALYYLFASFAAPLPWSGCNATWSQPSCVLVGPAAAAQLPANASARQHVAAAVRAAAVVATNTSTPTEDYFYHQVLQMTSGIDELGSVRVPLLLTLLLAWVLVYFSIWKSIRSSGKVVYVTVLVPYALIGVFLWRACSLEGAASGLVFLFKPRWKLLTDAKVWVNAAAQNFNSVGIAFGSMIAFSSYNRYDNRSIVTDTIVVCVLNSLTSLLAGVIVFATLGNVATELGRPIKDVVTAGPGLVFLIYPRALAEMPVPQLWAVLFFLMLLFLGIDSQFSTLEVVITTLQDSYGTLITRHLRRHEVLVLVVCASSLLIGLPHIFQGGIYFFSLMDYYVAGISLMCLAFTEVAAVTWCFGTDRLSDALRHMTGAPPALYFRLCWRYLAPALILAIWIFSWVDYERPTYGKYEYPEWAIHLGWALASLSIVPIPLCAALALLRAPGDTFRQRLWAAMAPDPTLGRDGDADGDAAAGVGKYELTTTTTAH